MSDAKMTEAILQTATDLTVGVIIAYLEEENPNGFDDDGYPIVHDLGEPTALEDAIHALTEWALNWHDLGKPPTPARWEIYTEAGYALELLHRVQENFALMRCEASNTPTISAPGFCQISNATARLAARESWPD